DVSARLDRHTVDVDAAALGRVRRQRACLAQPGRPQPLVDAHQPPARTGAYPSAFRTSTTTGRWSPWISITPSLTEPPTPQRFLSRPASARNSTSSTGTPETVVTALPRRPATSRRT